MIAAGVVLLVASWAQTATEAPAFRPPEVPAHALITLKEAGVRFAPMPVKPTRLRGGAAICDVPQGVSITRGPTGIKYARPARVNAAFALRLLQFERVLQQEAQAAFGRRVVKLEHLGTYVCRMMAAYPTWVSEHSFGNAIDIAAIVLSNGRRITVEQHWGPRGPATNNTARFLRRLGRRLYDEQVFNVVLTPHFDRRHHNHFHLDGAPYRVDGN